jgi:hypothetical protein
MIKVKINILKIKLSFQSKKKNFQSRKTVKIYIDLSNLSNIQIFPLGIPSGSQKKKRVFIEKKTTIKKKSISRFPIKIPDLARQFSTMHSSNPFKNPINFIFQ